MVCTVPSFAYAKGRESSIITRLSNGVTEKILIFICLVINYLGFALLFTGRFPQPNVFPMGRLDVFVVIGPWEKQQDSLIMTKRVKLPNGQATVGL